ncbi:MAG: hypothetical protein U0Q20_14335 [Mycobacterium sp.]
MIDDFWSTRPALQHVLQSARAAGAGPWAVLGSVLARGIVTIPPEIVLPPTIGGRMSLNLFIAHTGPSGGGKGIAEAVAVENFNFGQEIDETPLGSGEGIARTFRPVGTKPEDPNAISAALFTASEIDTVTALASRSGSTLSAEIRKTYSGEQLGFGNAGKDTRVVVAAHSYRACMTVGVQPLRSRPLLDAADGGLPQRFVWLPTSDPDAPDDPPEHPARLKIKRPHWLRPVGSRFDLHVPSSARDAIRAHRLAVLREDPAVDPLDGHALLTRLKVAVGLMALDGRSVVSDEDWALAGHVMDVSAHTRQRCQRALAEASRSANTARALADAERDEIKSDRLLQRCKTGVLRALAQHHTGRLIPHNQLRRGLRSEVRDYFSAAVNELIAENHIIAVRTPKGMSYRRPPVDDTSTPSDQRKPWVDDTSTGGRRPAHQRQRTRGQHRDTQQTEGESA